MARADTAPLAVVLAAIKKGEASFSQFERCLSSYTASPDVESVEAAPRLREAIARLEQTIQRSTVAASAALALIESRYRADVDSYAERLSGALRAAGWKPSGDPSRPVVEDIVFIDVKPDAPKVTINNRSFGDLRLSAVVAEIRLVLEAIRKRTTPPAAFVAELEAAYGQELVATGTTSGKPVHLGSLHLRLVIGRQGRSFRTDPRASSFKEYPLEVFRADLFNLLSSTTTSPNGKRACVASGADTEGAIFMVIPALGRPGYAARLWFE